MIPCEACSGADMWTQSPPVWSSSTLIAIERVMDPKNVLLNSVFRRIGGALTREMGAREEDAHSATGRSDGCDAGFYAEKCIPRRRCRELLSRKRIYRTIEVPNAARLHRQGIGVWHEER